MQALSSALALPLNNAAREQIVEFSIDQAEKSVLCKMIGQLGFSHIATHKHLSIELWSQGAINLLVNFQADCRPMQFTPVYGKSDVGGNDVIGNTSSNPLAEKHRRLAPWKGEFEYHAEIADHRLLCGVDHVTTAMTYEEMQNSLLTQRGVFRMRSLTGIDVSDGADSVESQVTQTSGGAVMFASRGKQAGINGAREALGYYPAVVNHIAFNTDDILVAAEILQRSGGLSLHVTDDYYNKVVRRFGVDEVLCARLQRFSICYDEDEYGEYYHLYTKVYGGRFGFEIVQRNGYKGFGAPCTRMVRRMQECESREVRSRY